MRISLLFSLLFALGLFAPGLFACAPNRQDAIDGAANAYCTRSVDCGWSDEADYDGCVNDWQDIFNLGWPDSTCADGQIDRVGWRSCLDTIDTLSCSDWSQGATSISACDAETVCRG